MAGNPNSPGERMAAIDAAIADRRRLLESGIAAVRAQFDRPVQVNYRPLGATPAQITDRIHTLQELRPASGGGLPDGYAEETWTICEDGTPTDVFVLVRRGS